MNITTILLAVGNEEKKCEVKNEAGKYLFYSDNKDPKPIEYSGTHQHGKYVYKETHDRVMPSQREWVWRWQNGNVLRRPAVPT